MALPTATDLKTYLKIETTADDTRLTALVARATQVIRAWLRRPITAEARTYTDWADSYYGARSLVIPDTPVETTTPAPVVTDADGETVDADTYRLDPEAGLIRGKDGTTFTNKPYTIAATVGLSVHTLYSAHIEPILSQVILEYAAELAMRPNPGVTQEAEAGVATSWGPDAFPPRFHAALAPWRQEQ